MHDTMPVVNEASEEDVPALCELLALLFSQEAEFAPNTAAQHNGLTAIIRNPQAGRILVARQRTSVVGMVSLLFTLSTALGARVAILEDMVVAKSARGCGIGSALLNHATAFATSLGIKRITLLTDHGNGAAHRFYARHGFVASTMVPMRRQCP